MNLHWTTSREIKPSHVEINLRKIIKIGENNYDKILFRKILLKMLKTWTRKNMLSTLVMADLYIW